MEFALYPVEDIESMRRLVERCTRALEKVESKVGSIKWKTAQETGLGSEALRHLRETQPEKCKPVKGKKSWLYNIS